MKRREEKIILKHQRKRRIHKIRLALLTIIAITIGVMLLEKYYSLSKDEVNKYTEKAKVSYKVSLKDNEFYEGDYLDEKTSAVASLINNIEVEFKYNLDLEKNQEYSYNYKIVAKTMVKEGSRENSIYETTDELLTKEEQESSSKNLEILENITINYDEYNDKINKFINVYNLTNTTSTLELDMYIYATNKYDGEQINQEDKVMSLVIPLTTKTVDISIDSNVVEDEGQIITKKSEYGDVTYILVLAIIVLVIGFVFFVMLIKYIIDKRSAETMYKQELRSILFNYKSYIQEINDESGLKDYKTIQINSFNEILGIRDTVQEPILMYTEKSEDRTKFMIKNDNILFVYILGVTEIRNELRAKSKNNASNN